MLFKGLKNSEMKGNKLTSNNCTSRHVEEVVSIDMHHLACILKRQERR